jgi:hypothetical protein
MSIMPLFTYHNLSPYSHRVITVLYDLQIFLCPMNVDATRVHPAMSPIEWTFGMTSSSS